MAHKSGGNAHGFERGGAGGSVFGIERVQPQRVEVRAATRPMAKTAAK